uniref:Uncharacterized protein n=1 Tax=Arundo donax TaxID=35708 RepID=A0A0A9A9B3_ARUDO
MGDLGFSQLLNIQSGFSCT